MNEDIGWIGFAARRLLALWIVLSASPMGANDMTEQNVNTNGMAAVKITYLGVQDKPVPSLLISSNAIVAPMASFERAGLSHSNDKFGVSNIVIHPAKLGSIVELSETYVRGKADSAEQAEIAVSILRTVEGRFSGYLLSKVDATGYFDKLRQELSDLEDAVVQFDAWRARTNL